MVYLGYLPRNLALAATPSFWYIKITFSGAFGSSQGEIDENLREERGLYLLVLKNHFHISEVMTSLTVDES